ncbi:MAG: GlsB/YeaQ/YmgE family stress response membrane protein [Bacteroides sp.]|nr:GlsB/YeaQ/YmgE family stress response membrane protein [Bacteroides sp.]
MGLLWSIIIGVVAGAIAGWLMKGRGFGFLVNLLVGLVGSVLGGWIYGLFGVDADRGVWGTLLMSVIGAVVLLWIVSLFNRK